MKRLPFRSDPIVVRTDFDNQRVWRAIKRSILSDWGDEDHDAPVAFVDDPGFEGLTVEQVSAAVPKDYQEAFIMVVDSVSIAGVGHPVLVVSLNKREGEFRAVAKEIGSVAVNLTIANRGFEDFVRGVGPDGVYRGF